MARGNTGCNRSVRGQLAVLSAGFVLVGCTAPEPSKPLSPVADPNAPMRVSTARVSTAPPDPVGQLFNDGPRQVVAYSVNTDPLAVLFRDPAFQVRLSPTASAQRIELAQTPKAQTPTPAPSQTIAPTPSTPTKAELSSASSSSSMEPITQTAAQKATEPAAPESLKTVSPVTASETTTPPIDEPKQSMTAAVPKTQARDAMPAVAATAGTAATTPVAIAAVKPTTSKSPRINEPITLEGLKQNAAAWPIAVKPANVFGSKGPDGSAWRGLIYKSPAKTPVKAIEPGKVVFAQPLRGYGNVIIVDHGKQYTSIYGYNEALMKSVGDTVQKGETIALVGDSGPLADDALYFEIRKGSDPINPSIYLTSSP